MTWVVLKKTLETHFKRTIEPANSWNLPINVTREKSSSRSRDTHRPKLMVRCSPI